MTGRWLSFIQDTGGKPKPVAVCDVTGERYPPPAGYMLHGVKASGSITCGADHPVGNSVGAIGWSVSSVVASLQGMTDCGLGHLSVYNSGPLSRDSFGASALLR
jgi:hypothetical protein